MNQDRFKFRVWDKSAKNYELTKFCAISPEGNLIYGQPQGGEIIVTTPEFADRVIIEQCTPLKDKNGKSMYCGDTIKFIRNVNIYMTDPSFRGNKYHPKPKHFSKEVPAFITANIRYGRKEEFIAIGNEDFYIEIIKVSPTIPDNKYPFVSNVISNRLYTEELDNTEIIGNIHDKGE